MAGPIRIARETDAASIGAIYGPHVSDGAATFETAVPGVETMGMRIRTRLAHYPWLVWDEDGAVRGYACASRFRERAAYDWIAETSVYVHPDAQRRGIARRLYGALLDVLRLQGVTQAVAVITLPGPGSVAFHQALGFAPAGTWRRCGWKLGRWWDVGLWQLELQTPADPPSPLRAFGALVGDSRLLRLLEVG